MHYSHSILLNQLRNRIEYLSVSLVLKFAKGPPDLYDHDQRIVMEEDRPRCNVLFYASFQNNIANLLELKLCFTPNRLNLCTIMNNRLQLLSALVLIHACYLFVDEKIIDEPRVHLLHECFDQFTYRQQTTRLDYLSDESGVVQELS